MAFYTAYNILDELEQVNNKRKAVIYISTGYDFDPFAEGRASRDRIQGGRFSDPMRFLIDEEQPVLHARPRHRRHRPAQVDARADAVGQSRQRLASTRSIRAGWRASSMPGSYLDQSEWRTYIQKTTSSLRYMAEETGGFRGRQHQRLRRRAQADRRRDQRLLRARVLFDEPGSGEADARARSQSRSTERHGRVTQGILAEDAGEAARAAAAKDEEITRRITDNKRIFVT